MGNKCQNAILLGRVGKLYGKSPAFDYLQITDNYLAMAVDLACACAHWEDENFHFEKSQTKAGNEALEIGSVLDQYRKQLGERG